MLPRPTWVDFGGSDLRTLQFIWDDAKVDEVFTGDASGLLDAAPEMSIRARLALLVGLYEWVVWRFDGLHERPEPAQVLEAAWCSTVDPRYLLFFELTREEWAGPVDGPLWCAFTYLEHGFRQAHAFEADTYEALEFVYLLAWHVIPDRDRLDQWLHQTLKVLVERFPVGEEDPFEDLFEHRIGEHLGPLVGRDTLDPSARVDPVRDRHFLSQTLQEAKAEENPFLATEEDLEDLGFEGTPFAVP